MPLNAMRLAGLAFLLFAVAGCDSGATSGDLDLGSFVGFDASVQAGVHGWAFHDLTRVEAAGLSAVPLQFEVGASDLGTRTVDVSIPLDGGTLLTGTFALSVASPALASGWAWDHSTTETVRESTVDGTVVVTEVLQRGGYVDVKGTVELALPSGTVTGTFRAVDQGRPMPDGTCTPLDCTTY